MYFYIFVSRRKRTRFWFLLIFGIDIFFRCRVRIWSILTRIRIEVFATIFMGWFKLPLNTAFSFTKFIFSNVGPLCSIMLLIVLPPLNTLMQNWCLWEVSQASTQISSPVAGLGNRVFWSDPNPYFEKEDPEPVWNFRFKITLNPIFVSFNIYWPKFK